MDGNYSLADIAAATGNGRNNDGMFGGDGSWWIIVLFIFAFFGWGNNGWGNSYARRGEHYVRGHYSRSDGRDAYDDYMTQKQSYRSGKSEDCKRKMLAALEEHLDELTTEMSDMSKDAECREERDLVKRYVEKLRDML